MQKELSKKFIIELKNEMKKTGWDIKTLSEKIGMSNTILYNILTFRSIPSLQQFISISEALNVSLNLLLNDESPIIAVNRISETAWNLQKLKNNKEKVLLEIDLTDTSESKRFDSLISSIKPYILISNQILLKP